MKRIATLVVPALAAALLPAGPARAGSEIPCVSEQDVILSPGLSLTSTSGTYPITDAPVDCTWSLHGQANSGTGTGSDVGRYGIKPYSCTDASTDCAQTTTIALPTSGGTVRLVTPIHGTFGPLQGGGVVGGTALREQWNDQWR